MDTTRELERLLEAGVPFSITIGTRGGFVVKLGRYLREASRTTEAATMEDAVNWLRANVSLEHPRGYSNDYLMNLWRRVISVYSD